MAQNNDKSIEQIKESAQKWKKQLDRQNDFAKNNYDRMGIVISKGVKEIIEEEYKKKGFKKFNAYVLNLISKDLGYDVSKKYDEVIRAKEEKENDYMPFK